MSEYDEIAENIAAKLDDVVAARCAGSIGECEAQVYLAMSEESYTIRANVAEALQVACQRLFRNPRI